MPVRCGPRRRVDVALPKHSRAAREVRKASNGECRSFRTLCFRFARLTGTYAGVDESPHALFRRSQPQSLQRHSDARRREAAMSSPHAAVCLCREAVSKRHFIPSALCALPVVTPASELTSRRLHSRYRCHVAISKLLINTWPKTY